MATILIVDDNSTSRRLLSYILQQEKHIVVTAINGLSAIQCLDETSVDLVLTDLLMPGMDGLAFLEHLRADERFRTLPVIALTGSGKQQHYLRAQAAGVTKFLTKPVESDEIVATVNRLVQPQEILRV